MPADTAGMRAALHRRRRARHLSMLSQVVVTLLVVLVVVAVPWPISLLAIPLGVLLSRGSEWLYARQRAAAIAAYERARDGA